jgi:PEP-CTERM motif
VKHIQILAAAAALGLTMAASGAQAAVINGGFETGDFSGWTQSGNTGWTGVSGSPYNHSGSYGAYMGPVGSDGTLSQSIATIAGEMYDIRFWLMNNAGTPNDFNVSFDGNLLFSGVDLPPFAFTEYSFNAIASGASALLEFGFRHDPSFLGLDDISVDSLGPTSVPEPGTLGLFGLGLAGLVVARRRKAKA